MGMSEQILTYIFLLWDGLGFFGFSHFKLPRLEGIPARWHDRFNSTAWYLQCSFPLVVLIYVLVTQIPLLGTVKTQTISYDEKENYEFEIRD